MSNTFFQKGEKIQCGLRPSSYGPN